MQLWQFFDALCSYPKGEMNHKLLTSTIDHLEKAQNGGTLIGLEYGQKYVANGVDLTTANQVMQNDYQALLLFNSATMKYFGDHDLNSISNYLSQQLHCAIFLINHDNSLLTATKEAILKADFPHTSFDHLPQSVANLKEQPHQFALLSLGNLTVNIHWIKNRYHHVGLLVFVSQPHSNQMLVNLVASYYRQFTIQQVLIKRPASRANRINYSKNLELALSQRSVDSPVVHPDLTNYLAKKGTKYIFSIRAHRRVNEIFTRNLINQLNRIFESGIYCYLDDTIVLLAAIEAPLRKHQRLLSQLEQFIANNRLQVGTSAPFESVMQLFNAYHQSDLAMTSASNHLVQYSEVAPRYLADNLKTQHQLNFINPAVNYLKDYDRQNHTGYFQTLVTYLLANFNVQQTAQKLNVHHNTVLYRLKIIKKLLHYQFDDPQQNASLYLSLILGQYLNNENTQ